MQKRTKFSIIFIIIFFLLIILAFVFSNKWTRDFQKFLLTQGSVEYAKANDIVLTETKEGIKDWEVYAAYGEYDTAKVKVTLTDIVGNYYKNNEVIMSFTAPKGTYDSNIKKIELTDGVRIVAKDNMELTAEKIYWVTSEDKIYAEGNIVYNNNNEMIALSDKASTTTDLSFIEIINNAEVRIYKDYGNKRGK